MVRLVHNKPFTVRYYEVGPSPGRILHEITRHKDGAELARLRVSWA